MHVSLNGFAASNEGMGLEWTFQGMSEEVAQAANTCLRDVDTAIFGRRTYQGMQGFWSTVPDNPESRPDCKRSLFQTHHDACTSSSITSHVLLLCQSHPFLLQRAASFPFLARLFLTTRPDGTNLKHSHKLSKNFFSRLDRF
jgi:hypothetical protein